MPRVFWGVGRVIVPASTRALSTGQKLVFEYSNIPGRVADGVKMISWRNGRLTEGASSLNHWLNSVVPAKHPRLVLTNSGFRLSMGNTAESTRPLVRIWAATYPLPAHPPMVLKSG